MSFTCIYVYIYIYICVLSVYYICIVRYMCHICVTYISATTEKCCRCVLDCSILFSTAFCCFIFWELTFVKRQTSIEFESHFQFLSMANCRWSRILCHFYKLQISNFSHFVGFWQVATVTYIILLTLSISQISQVNRYAHDIRTKLKC